jgi:hypothetical protein
VIAGVVLLLAAAVILGIVLGVFYLAKFVIGKIRRTR